MGSYRVVYNRLYEIAADQDGYFTTKQAIAAGYADNTHTFHVKAGNWVREHRGIYRLAKYPLGQHHDKILWCLWSRDRNDLPQGIYSHETALSFYDLSDINPAKLHMTVPPDFRKSTAIPKILILHRGFIHKEDMTLTQGFRITTPLKAIADLLVTRTVQMDHMAQAVKQAFQRGLITEAAVASAPRISDAVKKEIIELKKIRHG